MVDVPAPTYLEDHAMHSPTRERAAARNAWAGHPWMALGVRVAAFAVPVVASVLCTMAVSRLLPAPGSLLGVAAWWIVLTGLGMVVLRAVDRLARRLLPLAALFKLSLVFPDSAPSRYRVALRSGTTAQLRHRIDDIRANGSLGSTDAEAAETLLELIGALGIHDRLTRGHSERVRAYAHLIGEELGLGSDDLDRLHWAGLVHDVGKLYVSEDVLNKTDRLSDDEFEAIKVHPAAGAELCGPLRGWLGPWLDAVGEHHERWDGNGYPRGLVGTEISLAARIVSVADVFDVITSARSYKDPRTAVEAREELTRCSGTQFDPTVVRAFFNVGLGRLRLVMGPLSWISQVPLLRNIPTGPLAGAAASIAAAVGSIVAGDLVEAPSIERHPVPAAEVLAEAAASAPTSFTPAAPLTPAAPPTPPPSTPAAPSTPAPPTPPSPPTPFAIAPVPSPPATAGKLLALGMAREDRITVHEDHSVTVAPLGNDDSLDHLTSVGSSPFLAALLLGDEVLITPAKDFVGLASVSYHAAGPAQGPAKAAGAASIVVTVLPVNDAPSFQPGAGVIVAEDAGPVIWADWATELSAGPANEAGQSLEFATAAAEPSLFSSQPTVEPSGTLQFTPAPDAHGTTTVTVVLRDDGGTANEGVDTSAVAELTITITPVADAPHARADSLTLAEDDPTATIGLLANDSDADGDPLTITSVDASGLTVGTLVDNGDGTVSYTPIAGAHGTDTFTYTAADGTGLTATATVTITVTSVLDPPQAGADAYRTDEATPLIVSAPGLLANDGDHEGDPLTVSTTPVTSPSSGTLTLGSDGSFTYTPAVGFVGAVSFVYEIHDGTGLSDQATVTIAVDSGLTDLGYYLGTTGPSVDSWLFSLIPFGISGPEADHDGDLNPGLTIESSDQKLTETDGAKYQTWSFAPTAPLALNGPITLDLWSTAAEFEPTKDVDYSVWLHDCALDGTGCTLLTSTLDVHVDDWNGGVADWVRRDISLGSVDTTITSGRMLSMRLMFHHHDVWVAASLDRPSRLVVTEATTTVP